MRVPTWHAGRRDRRSAAASARFFLRITKGTPVLWASRVNGNISETWKRGLPSLWDSHIPIIPFLRTWPRIPTVQEWRNQHLVAANSRRKASEAEKLRPRRMCGTQSTLTTAMEAAD
jgi:hypothetical protein